jgi:hypothetical protein
MFDVASYGGNEFFDGLLKITYKSKIDGFLNWAFVLPSASKIYF